MAREKPYIEYESRGDREAREPMPADVKLKIKKGWALKQKINELTEQLKQVNAELAEDYVGAKLEIPGDVRVSITISETVSIKGEENATALEKIFKKDFAVYVDEQTAYKPKADLKKIVDDDEHPLHASVVAQIERKLAAPSVTWKAVK